ncbi:Phosphoacetylglucosamine mutase [Macrolepiota fuliginosa MF-IS2]|uniref:Phosphoacetylglucosamine mutase n=1 Tax=Macrolepiota fuliginosa MF-IS2 TaxID=1400762 RepID=A0A9P6C6P0_9AGAR|nr:Phosphoacetylglucosamine mutase [Macrolepiota fuliginosa MF-IS2]
MSFAYENIATFSDRHPKPTYYQYQYGTAGFRTLGDRLDSVVFRVGILAALRSMKHNSHAIGVMITASHNPEQDNGVKLIDPRGEMLEASWEVHATTMANARSTEELIEVIQHIVDLLNIDTTRPAVVIYGRDTRPTGESLVAALQDGIQAAGARGRDAGITTTPVVHYLVRATNSKDYGEATEAGYFTKMTDAYKKLVAGRPKISSLLVDCANGVGTMAAEKLKEYLGDTLPIILENTSTTTPGALNHACGADYVKTMQRLPPSLNGKLTPTQRGCSLDGDADRLMYFYIDEKRQFRMLDGDKIATLVAAFIVDLVKASGLQGQIRVGIVQTAYANGASTKYLTQRLPVKCVPTGVKHLHHAAESFDIGVYFEANGHGTVLFSRNTQEILENHEPNTPAQQTALNHIINLTKLINQTVGDALSDMLLVEVVLAHKSYSGIEWDSLYTDLPNRLVKVVVGDRNAFVTTDAERRLVSPPTLQQRIDELVLKYDGGRAFVRPSGTEDVVRVYAEASTRAQADDLAFRVAGMVYDESGGDSTKRPKEFI